MPETEQPASTPSTTPSTPEAPAVSGEETSEQMKVREEKRARLIEDGQGAYPVRVPRTHSCAAVHAQYPSLEAGEETDDVVSVAGRVMFSRLTGKLCFAALQDGDGSRLQVMVSLKEVGEEAFAAFKRDVDLGDFISVTGRVICSKRGELSVFASAWQMAAKTLRPLPVLHKEMSEEARVRQRYVDLITRPASMDMALLRPKVVRSIRDTLHAEEFVEVETPMLQTMHGGASARPFVTHHNATDMDLYLRIAPELFLKRALVGGIDKVFEINRNFRNEGMDSTHASEFAAIEFYFAYADYRDGMALTKKIIQNAAHDAFGTHSVTLADGEVCDFGGEWAEVSMFDSLSEALGFTLAPDVSLADMTELAKKHGVEYSGAHMTAGKLIEELWEELVLPSLSGPTFVTDFPVETSPLTKERPDRPGMTEKWDLYVRGFELGTGYSELNDPVVQRSRFEDQAKLGAAGDDEAMGIDEDFLRAMEHGMPPAAGVGFGIDRLLMALTGQGIRETILFPLVKPE